MALTDQECTRNTTFAFNINFTTNGSPVDITGYEVKFTVREEIPDTKVKDDTDAKIAKTYTNGGALGVIAVSLTADETNLDPKTYKYDIQYKKPNGDIFSSRAYDFVVHGDVTRSV